jgi:hypothetical protein
MRIHTLIPFLTSLQLFAAINNCRPLNSFEQGYELKQNQMPAAYNAPAHIDVRGSWDLYFSGDYIYWQPNEENLELGISNSNPSSTELPISGNIANLDFKFKSGFQVGIGLCSSQDHWDFYGEYTWLTGRHTGHVTAPSEGGVAPFWGHPANVPDFISSGKGRWKLDLNILDLNLGRSSYIGTKLTFRPFFGARAAWINQKYVATYENAFTGLPYEVRASSTSRGVGFETGLESHWLLGCGFRLIGTAEADLLFTSYNLRLKEEMSDFPSTLAVNLRQHRIYYLRPHLYLDAGFGWGTYLSNHDYHIDFSATYNFQTFWNQNMFRHFVDSTAVGTSLAPNGDLYIQGFTGSFRIDF